MASGTTGADQATNVPFSTSYSAAHSGDSLGQSVAPTSLSSDETMATATSTQSVLSANSFKTTAGHSLANNTVAGLVVAAAGGLALITFLVTFLFMRRKRRSRRKRRHHRLSNGPLVPRKIRDRPVVVEPSGPSSLIENYLPQSADDNTVELRARTTLEQIGFHVESFYQSMSVAGSRSSDDELATFQSPYLPTPLVTLLDQSKDATPSILHSLAYFVTTSISPIQDPKNSLLPIEFVTIPSSIGSTEVNISTKAELSQVLSKWRVLTAYLRSSSPDNPAYSVQVDEQIQHMATSFSSAFAPWKDGKYRSKDRVRNLSEILKQAADLGMWLFSQPSTFRFDWPTGTPQSTREIIVLPGLVKETDEKGIWLEEAQVLIEPVLERP